jgi:hypothetical protein
MQKVDGRMLQLEENFDGGEGSHPDETSLYCMKGWVYCKGFSF